MPSYQVKLSSTAYPLVFLMVDSADHIAAKTGLTPTVTISKAGAAFGSPSGAVTEIGSGWYKCAGNATDSGTLGPLLLHATASGADPTDMLYEVVAVDPQATSFGLALAKTTNITGFNDIAATAIVSSGAITTSSGAVSTVTTTGTVTTVSDKTGYSLTQAFPTNFSSLGISAAGKVNGVVLVDTLTTYTGNTVQTGDSYARIGANGASLTALGDTRLANLDATVSSRSTYAGADTSGTTTLLGRLTDPRATNLDNLDAAISSRSIFAGGAVASVTAPVTISQTFPANFADLAITASTGRVTAGTVSDKTGYSLVAAGLDLVVVESGINARQALSGIMSTSTGKVSGMETNTPAFKGANNNTTRVSATTDADGNRLTVALNLPT